jgi:hypothetical protein
MPRSAISRRRRSQLARSRTCWATPRPPHSIGHSGAGTTRRRNHFAHSVVMDVSEKRHLAGRGDSRRLEPLDCGVVTHNQVDGVQARGSATGPS